ncbi:MAG: L-arabinose isomerase [Eubacteriales bacterium]|nr:L-arabinose isomerase [Lachnospiraceae bacterium]MDD5859218.1 L-arabinose isomerase [Eubacteriales bacterium]MCI1334033.1 L-arabinose isomerase [Lachnospiraceae bacterium]MCI1358202.1 L-arabinose isomerase [Lachnospiraceae bacterium]MCI1378714.1 L-arabinose isomerase [Lachnospiraceae bacterium]
MEKLYFIPGSQDLYGEACLKQVAADVAEMVAFLNEKLKGTIVIEQLPTVETSEICLKDMRRVQDDDDCVGVITWMHTFSPAKMWIKGLQELRKPLLHLHTQANEKLPYDAIDMDFMNLNQAAHGDREFGFILAKLHVPHEVVAGYYRHDDVVEKIRKFAQVAKAIGLSHRMRVATFGNNMRDVAVTDGNRLECEIKYGWEIKYWGIGEIADLAKEATDEEVDAKMAEYESKYTMATDNIDAVRTQARYEVAFDKFIAANKCSAFTDNFQDLHGLDQLPGIAAQNLMAKGIGFGPEGDYKIAAFSAVLMKMAEGRKGATGFIEDYTYDLTPGQEVELASHMLEVPASFAATKPEIQVHPLGIGGKADPARLVFDGVTGDGIQVTLIDLGDHFRIVCADVELVKQPLPMPKLPVARIMYRHKPNFEIGTAAWCYAGGAHHSVISTALNRADIEMFARLTGTELVTIGDDTTEEDLRRFTI